MSKNKEKKRNRRGVRDTGIDEVEYKSFTPKMKFEKKSEVKWLAFPKVDKNGNIIVKEIDCFSVVDGAKLSDGKWHQFQLPESDELYEKCQKHPLLKEQTVRAVLVIVFDDDVTKVKKDIGYHFEYLTITKTRQEMLSDLIDEAEDDDLKDISYGLVRAKLNSGDNSLKMQTYGLTLKGDNPARKGKCKDGWDTIKKKADEEWERLNDTLVPIKEDSVIEVLLDTDEDEEEGSRKKKKSKKKDKSKSKKRKFSKKDLD